MSRVIILVLLIAGLIVSVFLLLQQTRFFGFADVSDAPSQVKISNITDNSFTVSWMTAKAVPGFVIFSQDDTLSQTALDDRDSGVENSYVTHHVTLKDLEPATLYYFKIGSGASVYDDQGEIFTQATAPVVFDDPPWLGSLNGAVYNEDNSLALEALVYLEPQNGAVLSSYTTDGNFSLALTDARSADLSQYLTISDDTQFKVTAEAGAAGSAEQEINGQGLTEEQQLILKKDEVSISQFSDLNNDGVVNAVDFALYVKHILKL